ncbi:hypothetical protein NDU88_002012 [Pleurodeles waltl]|uniref:Uncharacterized protein n=1 Tax=Pleurodeles waltl TaxID=8319 RepID=A0AAV7SC07_PLEWA|nr:hypothetical protein NDU88_002012 [Pleurodeles waltl]
MSTHRVTLANHTTNKITANKRAQNPRFEGATWPLANTTGKIGRRRNPEVREETMDVPPARHQEDLQPQTKEQTGDPTLHDILQTITGSWEALESKTVSLETNMTILRDNHL